MLQNSILHNPLTKYKSKLDACRVTVDGKIQFACVDGPEFDAHKVDFDELIQRLEQYKKYELDSLELYNKECCGGNKK